MSDPRDSGRPAPREPRASQRAQRGHGDAGGPQPSGDPIVDGLLAYAAATDIAPAPTLATRIHARVGQEPRQTPVRRFVVALLALKLGRAWFAFKQAAGAAIGRGSFPAMVRVQALALMLVAVMAMGALGAGGAMGLDALVRPPVHPAPTLPPGLVKPSLVPSTMPLVSPEPASPSPSIDTTIQRPGPTTDTGNVPPGSTPTPTPRDGQHTPRPGHTPAPTPRPIPTPRPTHTPQPGETPKPTHTPKPTLTPKPTRMPRPTETPEPEQTDGPEPTDGGGSGGNGGNGGLDAIWFASLVLLVEGL
jgi:hypothetical protein